MNTAYRNAVAAHGGSLVTHIGLINQGGAELSGGSYARQTVTWASPSNGTIRPSTDRTFQIPAGSTVAGWKGFTAATGGTDYGGASVPLEEYNNAGEYTLAAALTAIHHAEPV